MLSHDVKVFMHIPKTGGSTLSHIIRNQYKLAEMYDHDGYMNKVFPFDQISLERKSNIKMVLGHYSYGIHRYFSKNATYFTMLREPVDRVISLYYFLKTFPGYEYVKNMTLEEFVRQDPQGQNQQTLMASGRPDYPHLFRAKENLKQFAVVGTTDMFNETLFLLKKEFGWGNITYTKQNITKKRASKLEVPPSTIELIKQYNALDMELYEYAKLLLTSKLQTLTSMEQQELRMFKQQQHRLRS